MGRKRLPTPEKYCEWCGKKLERRPLASGYYEPLAYFNQRKYCSLKCSNTAAGKERESMPTESPKTSRQRARKIVPYCRCEICGKDGYTEVHHIDKNPLNNSPDNLIRLCKSCHSFQHAERAACVVCGLPAKGHNLCDKHWQAWRKSNKRGYDTEYTVQIKIAMKNAGVQP